MTQFFEDWLVVKESVILSIGSILNLYFEMTCTIYLFDRSLSLPHTHTHM